MNVLLLVVDALRYDCLPNMGEQQFLHKYDVANELNVDHMESFAEDGVTFSTAVSTAPNTPPSHASIFTGLYPPRHGIRSFFHRKLPKHSKTIFEIFDNNGYETFCVADEAFFNDILEITRGCNHFIDHSAGDEVLFEKLEEHSDDDVFLFQRFLDVHFPYFVSYSPPHEGYFEDSYYEAADICDRFEIPFILNEGDYNDADAHRKQWFKIKEHLSGVPTVDDILVPKYIRSINKFDQGRFAHYVQSLDELGMLDDTLVILMSDHGESVITQEKVNDGIRRFDHCNANIDDMVRIPLVMWGSEQLPAGEQIDAQVSSVDVLPTILDLVGIQQPDEGYDIQGKSLLPVITGKQDQGSPAYSELAWWNDGQFNDANEFINNFYSEGKLLDYEALPRRKSIRTPEYRYVELGEELTEKDWNTNDEKFVRTLIRKYLAKWDTKNKPLIDKQVERLKNGETDRETLEREFYIRGCLSNKKALFNLEVDPYEEVNLLIARPKQYDNLAEEMRSELHQITTKTADEVNYKSDDRGSDLDEEVLENLNNLGYL